MPLDQKKADKNLQVPQETINANIGELVLQEPYIIDNFVSELVLQQPSNNSLIRLCSEGYVL